MGIITLNKTFKIMELFEGHFMHAGNCFQLTAQTKYEWDNKGYKAQKWMKGGCSTVKFHETEKWNKYFDLRSNKPLDTLPYVTAYRFEPIVQKKALEPKVGVASIPCICLPTMVKAASKSKEPLSERQPWTKRWKLMFPRTV